MGRQTPKAAPPIDPVKAKAARTVALVAVLVGFSLLLYAMTVVKLIG